MRIYNFFFPYAPPSGISSLFVRLAEELARQPELLIRLIDFKGGAMARAVPPESKIEMLEYARDSKIAIGSGETLILQAEVPAKFRRQLKVHPMARLVLWQLHPYNLIPPLLPLTGHRNWWLMRPAMYRRAIRLLYPQATRNLLEYTTLAAQKRSLFFQDRPGLDATQTFLGSSVLNPILLPVPIRVPDRPKRTMRVNGSELHVAWIGRLYDFKIYILLHTLSRFVDYACSSGTRIVFHVVGDGPELPELDQFYKKIHTLKVVKYGDIDQAALRQLLLEEIDLVTAMGTAALEAAAIGLPVILLDLSYGPVPRDYQFRWLFNAQGFDLGHTITSRDCNASEDSFSQMMTMLIRDYATVARQSFDYAKKHHSLEAVATKFLELMNCAELKYGDVPTQLWHKTWARRVYERLRY